MFDWENWKQAKFYGSVDLRLGHLINTCTINVAAKKAYQWYGPSYCGMREVNEECVFCKRYKKKKKQWKSVGPMHRVCVYIYVYNDPVCFYSSRAKSRESSVLCVRKQIRNKIMMMCFASMDDSTFI